ncbi:Spy/CpxP family protein refolding chaperone [Rippkaea orientalis]|nr:hypothetical protein [Rippkaea orientalis]
MVILSGLLLITLSFSFVPPAFSQGSPSRVEKWEKLSEKLNLTEDQKAQWQEIKRSQRERVSGILTPEQQEQAKEKKWRSLNLTDAQKEQMRAIKQETNQQIQGILTPEQQQIWSEMKKNRQKKPVNP